jgi:hypothetical protein
MGAIARNIANKITTSGVFTPSALNSSSVTGITVLANASDGITFISSQTASNSASVSFTSGLTSTYKAYKFVFMNIRPTGTGGVDFQFQTSTNGGSTYATTCTSNYFVSYHSENDTISGLTYDGGGDLAQSTSYQRLTDNQITDADEGANGSLILFNPSSTTCVKHFIGSISQNSDWPGLYNSFPSGYFNTTSVVNAINFNYNSGNVSSGTIYLYGIK